MKSEESDALLFIFFEVGADDAENHYKVIIHPHHPPLKRKIRAHVRLPSYNPCCFASFHRASISSRDMS